MRGVSFRDMDSYLARSVLMSKYNQQYSEIDNMSFKMVLFLLHLAEAEGQFEKSEMKKAKGKMKRR